MRIRNGGWWRLGIATSGTTGRRWRWGRDGRGRIAERRFHADGAPAGETELRFCWP